MAPIIEWISKVKELLKQSPLAANSCFGLILFVLEKIVEIEFVCPCKPTWNPWHVSAFFVVPAVIVFVLISYIQSCGFKQYSCEAFMKSLVPTILWLILLFLDGRYVACAHTSWSGKYEIDNASLNRWCNPSNSTEGSLTDTQAYYAYSQYAGIMAALGLAVVYFGYLCIICKDQKNTNETTNVNELEMFSPKLDGIVPKPDEIVPKPDEIVPKPDEIVPKPDEIVPKPDEIVPKPDEIVPKPDEIVSKPENPIH
ncbi:uncharacterized protein LOC121647378 isoform X1 [Melanotaenia boesemani]|uniref:uncharacterized protein LOC121647378 isoform X1 n=1 Tax=Melanotaenia boesemani TaxID=1250792 RepID=UPI001C053BA0|nr:uncharacterized protein LOC121647378 isoform X1 [Melanotaenia boesemani]